MLKRKPVAFIQTESVLSDVYVVSYNTAYGKKELELLLQEEEGLSQIEALKDQQVWAIYFSYD
jgi:hypothetical protein